MPRGLLFVVLVLSACTSTPIPPTPTPTQVAGAIFPVVCGAATDVGSEPNWRQYADYRPWKTADGCLVRIDVLADRPGPAHCGFDVARVITTGIPIGTRYTDERSSVTYVRDPGNAFGHPATAAAFEAHAKLPEGAVDTGLRQRDTELWVDPTDRSVIYLVSAASVERWPRDPNAALCV